MQFQEEEIRLIQKSRALHERILDDMVSKGIPDDPKIQSNLIKALGSLDKNVLGVARLRVEDDANKTNAGLKDQLAALILESKAKRQQAPDTAVPPELPASVVRTNPVDGELDQGTSDMTYKKFITEQNASQ